VGEESARESAPIRLREEPNFKAAANLLSAVADLHAGMISVRRDFCSKLREIGGK
jgi:hypothetical protein